MKSAVLYHYPCPDGAFAALAAHLYFSSPFNLHDDDNHVTFFPNSVYDPIRAEELPVDELDAVYLLDFSGTSEFIKDLCRRVQSVIILDHHKTALDMFSVDNFPSNMLKVIDMERSGAMIAYDFFTEKLLAKCRDEGALENKLLPESERARVVQLIQYIQDADLWRWSLPNSKAFSSGLKDLNIDFNCRLNSNLFQQLVSLDPQNVISKGQVSLADKQRKIDKVLQQSYEIALGEGTYGNCLAVGADAVSDLRSEIGNQLAAKSLQMKLRGIGAVVYRVPELNNNQLLKISLRSLDSEDTTVISEAYGGGGHRNASSFMLNETEFVKWKVQQGS